MSREKNNRRKIREVSEDLPGPIAEETGMEPEEGGNSRKNGTKGNILKYIIVAVLLLALVNAVVGIVNSVGNGGDNGRIIGQMELEPSARYDFEVFGKNVVTCNHNGVFAYDKNGNEKWKIEIILSDPSVYVNGDNLLLTDAARNTARVINKNGKIKTEIDFGGDCVTASVNKNGWVSAILSVKGYKAQVAVFDKEGKLRYTWNSANNDVISAELSDDDKILAVAQIDSSSSAEANGVVSLFDITTEGKPYCGINTEDNIVSYIRWSGNNLVCLGNRNVFKIDDNGKELWKYEYPGEMTVFNATDDNVFAFAVNSNTTASAKSSVIYTINDDGKELGSTEIVGDIKNIEVSGSRVAAVTSDRIISLNKNASVKNECTLSRDVSKGLIMDGGSSFFVVSGTSAEILAVK